MMISKRVNQLIACATFFFLIGSCTDSSKQQSGTFVQISGPTMGTQYHITLESMIDTDSLKTGIDSLLEVFNMQVSTYIPESTISQFNQMQDTFRFHEVRESHFYRNLNACYELYEQTHGYFDPTVMPLVNYWGFGYEKRQEDFEVDSSIVDSLVKLVGLHKILKKEEEETVILIKPHKATQLDFSAIAKGDGVDLIAHFLKRNGLDNYMIEIGGEIYASGNNPKGKEWLIGINRPSPDANRNDIVEKLTLSNKGLATSGNYRNFYEKDGAIYSHTINPKTGYTEHNRILSASVISNDCMKADALATSCMTMGVDSVKKLAPDWESSAVFIIYQEDSLLQTWATKEFQNYLKK